MYYIKSHIIEYLKNTKNEFIFMSILFIFSLIIGYIIAIIYPQIASISLEDIAKLAEMVKGLSLIQIFLIIFINNTIKSLFILVSGFIFGIIPLLFIAYNGYFLGIVCHKIILEKGFLYLFAGLLPHGIIEIPMVLLSGAIGLRLGIQMFATIKGQNISLKNELSEGLKLFFYYIAPLLFFAAIIETFVTSAIISFVS